MQQYRHQSLFILFCCTFEIFIATETEEVLCTSDDQCGNGERCDKICSWTHSHAKHFGCNLICVKEPFATNQSDISKRFRRTLSDVDTVESAFNDTSGINTTSDNSTDPVLLMMMNNGKNDDDDIDNSTVISTMITIENFTEMDQSDLTIPDVSTQQSLQTLENKHRDEVNPENDTSTATENDTTEELLQFNGNSTELLENLTTTVEGSATWLETTSQSNYVDEPDLSFMYESKNDALTTTDHTELSNHGYEILQNDQNDNVDEANSLLEKEKKYDHNNIQYVNLNNINSYKNSENCPSPTVCAEECAISIDKNGCQTCECLWKITDCSEDIDCRDETKFCDLGKCQCRRGFVQDMEHSGQCKVASEDNIDGSVSKSTTLFDGTAEALQSTILSTTAQFDDVTTEQLATTEKSTKIRSKSKHHRNRRFVEKLQPGDQFQWPGPCDDDSHCPPNLYCINGNCWHQLNKPIRMYLRKQHQDESMIPKRRMKSEDLVNTQVLTSETDETTTISSEMMMAELEEPFTETPMYLSANIDPFDDLDAFTTVNQSDNNAELITATGNKNHFAMENLKRGDDYFKLRGEDRPDEKVQLAQELDPFEKNEESLRAKPIWTAKNRIFMEYTRQQRLGKPVRIELFNARALRRDECLQDEQCGRRMICCQKKWCDLSADCGTGNFCLPSCELTKRVSLEMHEAEGLVPYDLIYD